MHFNFLADDMSSNIANRHVDCLSNRFDFELLLNWNSQTHFESHLSTFSP